jgi:hypothetical protein
MTTQSIRDRIIQLAIKEIGYEESPKNSNRTKFGKRFGLDGQPWCGIFVSEIYQAAGVPIKRAGFARGFAGCQYAVAHLSKWGKVVTEPRAGDIVFFDWNRDGRYDHVGIFQLWSVNRSFFTIEGNTAIGNDSNGGKVMARDRTASGGYKVLFVRANVLEGM